MKKHNLVCSSPVLFPEEWPVMELLEYVRNDDGMTRQNELHTNAGTAKLYIPYISVRSGSRVVELPLIIYCSQRETSYHFTLYSHHCPFQYFLSSEMFVRN